MPAEPALVTAMPLGIHVIDTGFQRERFDAAYLIAHEGRGAFIDTGTTHTLPRLLGAIDTSGLTREAIDWVIVTHVHLDHAGGAGALMRELPNARLVVHQRGARHMIDPTQLLAGARAVYGDAEVARSYGEVPGIAAERVLETHDGTTLELAGRPLLFLDTPGHAKHHHCIWDAASRSFFTGDTFGLSYREFDTAAGPWIMPSSTPVQFEPDALRASIERLVSYQPQCMYLTHFGGVGDVPRLAASLLEQIDAMVRIGQVLRHADDRHNKLTAALGALYLDRLKAHRSPCSDAQAYALLAGDIELNAQGVGVWLDRGG